MEATQRQQILGYDFDSQRPIDHYIVDFYCKQLRLAIEVDGSIHFMQELLKKKQSAAIMFGLVKRYRWLQYATTSVNELVNSIGRSNMLRPALREDIGAVVGEIKQWITRNEV